MAKRFDKKGRLFNPPDNSIIIPLKNIAHAGFPSPADDYLDQDIDLKQLLIPHPASTYLFRVKGHSMEAFGIHDDDLLVVDAAVTPKSGDIVLGSLDGEFLVKQMVRRDGHIVLVSGGEYPPILTKDMQQFEVFGRPMWVLRKL